MGDKGMQDEYSGTMDATGEIHTVPEFTFENGSKLRQVPVCYKTWGKLNDSRNNCVVICHALTGNASVDVWWGGMVGEGKSVDTSKYFVICSNVLGSCYGTCGPTSINPDTGKPYGKDFPFTTVRDVVNLQKELLKGLGIEGVQCVIGGSMGGMQVLEWQMIDFPKAQAGVVLSTGARHTPWQIGVSELQRQAIYADPKYNGGAYSLNDKPNRGLAVARQIAMVSYRTHNSYLTKFGRKLAEMDATKQSLQRTQSGDPFAVQTYLSYQGQKFVDRGFDANSYITLTRCMDSHDISRNRGDYLKVLNSITQPMLIVGITSDVLYPPVEQIELAEHLGNAELKLIESDEGHDGFLLEQSRIGPLIHQFLDRCAERPTIERLQASVKELNVKLEQLTTTVQKLTSKL
eukprot:m.92530 g.92530  ORF g.92530 m.92530 type:complete len:404 (-) comp13357_c0_seq1:2331-3542(-)